LSACGKILSSTVSYLGTQNENRTSDVTNQQIAVTKSAKEIAQYSIKKVGIVLNLKRIGVVEPNQF